MPEDTTPCDVNPEIMQIREDVQGTSFDVPAVTETGVADPDEADTVDDMKAVSPPAAKPPETEESEDDDGKDIGGEGGANGE